MTDEEEQIIWVLVHFYKNNVYWVPDSSTCKKIKSVTMHLSNNKELNEPSLCANFSDGTYVALYGAEFRHFKILSEIDEIVADKCEEVLSKFSRPKVKEEFF